MTYIFKRSLLLLYGNIDTFHFTWLIVKTEEYLGGNNTGVGKR